MNKILIIPDVHGRTFWKKAIDLIDIVDKVVFLGDYLDPYPHENISKVQAINNFKEILKFKSDNFDKVVLLIGNHDIHYWPYFKSDWGCRRDDKNFDEISKLFLDNLSWFKISYLYNKYLFSHAGVTNEWLKTINDELPQGTMLYSEITESEPLKVSIETLDSLLNSEHGLETLFMVSRERGGSWKWGSCLWADICEHDMFVPEIPNIYQIFGHTMTYPDIYKAFIAPSCAMLDSQHCYMLDVETGNFIEEEND